ALEVKPVGIGRPDAVRNQPDPNAVASQPVQYLESAGSRAGLGGDRRAVRCDRCFVDFTCNVVPGRSANIENQAEKRWRIAGAARCGLPALVKRTNEGVVEEIGVQRVPGVGQALMKRFNARPLHSRPARCAAKIIDEGAAKVEKHGTQARRRRLKRMCCRHGESSRRSRAMHQCSTAPLIMRGRVAMSSMVSAPVRKATLRSDARSSSMKSLSEASPCNAASSMGRAMPTRRAPSARALAASSPDRTPAVAMSG